MFMSKRYKLTTSNQRIIWFLTQTCMFTHYKEKAVLKIGIICFGVLLREKPSFATSKLSIQ